jgi:hypothetical protein
MHGLLKALSMSLDGEYISARRYGTESKENYYQSRIHKESSGVENLSVSSRLMNVDNKSI